MEVNLKPDAPRLSVCIPTYNFGPYIGAALESVLRQIAPGVEIVVLDSGSTDETPHVVQGLQAEHRCLRYVRAAERHGIDRDMARVVQLALGEYCWLFSADDVMVDGALAQVLAQLDDGPDLLLCMHSNDSLNMEPVDAAHPVMRLHHEETFDLSKADQLERYCGLAVTTEAFFSFMGGLIIKRARWDSVPLNENFVGTCWAHVARLIELMPRGLTVKFLPRVLLRRRADNDSFNTTGVVRRYALAIVGYQRVAAHFWGTESVQAFHIRRVLRYEFRLRMFLAAKYLCRKDPSREDRTLLNSLVRGLYADPGVMNRLRLATFWIFPAAAVPAARVALRALRFVRSMVTA